MKEEILKRAMFAMPLSKEAQGTGIMSGFDMDEMEEMDEDVDENADMEEMPPMARTPQNPEILMNTLRGDMRSLDARYMELAQMVGEEAAMETPPEVLAMLMGQMGAQQSGIGALPQGQDMMPPGAGMPPPDQMGAPQPAPAMPQGGIPMPSGMESAPPFFPGAEAPQQFNKGGVAKRRGDDAQLLEGGGGGGGFTSPTFSAPARPPAFEVTPTGQAALARPPSMFNRDYLGGLDKYLGGKMMAPQPSVSRLTGGSPPINLTRQQQEALVQNPATGVISQGTGTRLAPYTTMSPLTSPTLSRGFSQGMNRLAAEYPRVAALLPPSILAAVGIVGPTLTEEQRSTPLTALEQAKYDETMRQIDAVNQPTVNQRIMDPRDSSAARKTDIIPPALAPAMKQEEAAPSDDPLGAFITEKLAAFDKREEKAAVKQKSKADRIRESRDEYTPLFEELLGGDKESAKINALLLLSEAGLKLARSTEPTIAMAVSDAASGLPRGVAAIAAQERELGIKSKSAALQQAISDVTSQDAAAAARSNLIAEYALKGDVERIKSQGLINKDGGAGLVIQENSKGSRVGVYLDQDYVDSVKQNPIAISFNEERASPFVRDLGPAATVVTRDPKLRVKIEEDMNQIVEQLNTVRSMKDVVNQAYGPSTFFTGIKNEYFVPLLPDAIVSPNVNKAQVISVLKNGFSELGRGRASQDGRLSVQQEKWQRENDEPIANPGGLLQNAELAAKVLQTKETALLNEWYNSATKLGVFDRNRVIDTPPTGSKNDPFVMPTDAASNAQMQAYLRATFGSVRDPNTKIYIRDQSTGKLFDISVQNLLNPRPQ